MRRIEGKELAESWSRVFPQSDSQDGGRQGWMQGFLGPVRRETGLLVQSATETSMKYGNKEAQTS